mmetsp:Transcript_21682/g.26273  ORF Transcript_21682/g.26273 Transcript_21682/m.26273 type:complete len:179 (+) Transcript_21682:177-713(+)
MSGSGSGSGSEKFWTCPNCTYVNNYPVSSSSSSLERVCKICCSTLSTVATIATATMTMQCAAKKQNRQQSSILSFFGKANNKTSPKPKEKAKSKLQNDTTSKSKQNQNPLFKTSVAPTKPKPNTAESLKRTLPDRKAEAGNDQRLKVRKQVGDISHSLEGATVSLSLSCYILYTAVVY